jgi:cell volume regulation protein A
MDVANQALLVGALLLLVSILASALSHRIGMPVLLLFLLVGMLAGEDGPLGIEYDDYRSAYFVGSLALAVILLDGGLRTRREVFRVALAPALSLASAGVIGSAVAVGAFAVWLLELGWLEGMLVGAIIASTDAAAVFALLHAHQMTLRRRVAATLEVESGSNDPMAVFLTLVLVEALAAGNTALDWSTLGDFAQQFGLGAIAGFAGGRLLSWLLGHVTLTATLYPLLTTAGGVAVFALTNIAGGSGFLAVYLTGIVVGNRALPARQSVLQIHDGLAWLSQIGLFLMLGLLVTPSRLLPVAFEAFLIAGFLMLVARPLSVVLSLAPFRLPWREQLFIGWVGLRGAVPIVLALFPLLAGLPGAQLYFHVAFFVVLASLLLQGWTLAPVARWLRLEAPPEPEPIRRVSLDLPGSEGRELIVCVVEAGSQALDYPIRALPLAAGSRLCALGRAGELLLPGEAESLEPGDAVCIIGRSELVSRNSALFAAPERPAYLNRLNFLGEFAIDPAGRLDALAEAYDVPLAAGQEQTVGRFLDDRFHGRAVVGDRTRLGPLELVVREVVDGRITRVGLKLNPGNKQVS